MSVHSLELLEHACDVARQLDFGIRQEWMDGISSSYCRIRGRRWIFLDATAPTTERLRHVALALATCRIERVHLWPELQRLVDGIRAELDQQIA